MISRIVAAVALLLGIVLSLVPSVARADSPFISPSGGNFSTTFCLFADGFKPYEIISLWVQLPDGTVEDAGVGYANSSGAVGPTEGEWGNACYFGTPTWPDGQVLAVARGRSSNHEATAKFLYHGGFAEPDGAGLHVSYVPAAPRNTPFITLTATGFKPYEHLSAWMSDPDGNIESLGDGFADGQGHVYFLFTPVFLPGPGEYTVVVHSASGVEYSAKFTAADIDNPLPEAGIRVNPDNGTYQTSIVVNGAGFDPFEPVSVWFALPNDTVISYGTLYADWQGRVLDTWVSYPGDPFGVYTVVMHGLKSHRHYIATFDIHPIPLDP